MTAFDSSRPVWIQLQELVENQILSGFYNPGQKLPSIRELSMQYQVNPNTLQKALAEVEKAGLLTTRRTSGKFVTEDAEALLSLRKRKASARAMQFVQDMKKAGFEEEELVMLVQEAYGNS